MPGLKEVEIRWEPDRDRFRVEGTHRGHVLTVNAPFHDPPPTGFSASELLLAGVGSCSAWDVVEMLRKQRQDVTGVDVRVTGEQAADPPWPYIEVGIHYTVRGRGVSRRAAERAVSLSCTKYCSVLATIRPTARITTHLEVEEDQAVEDEPRAPVDDSDTG